jgi:hypothetical protein
MPAWIDHISNPPMSHAGFEGWFIHCRPWRFPKWGGKLYVLKNKIKNLLGEEEKSIVW